MDIDPFTLAQEAIKLEKQFQANGCHGRSDNPAILVNKCKLPFVISAPHAVLHHRNGREKDNEVYTGALALQLANRTGASVIIYARTTKEDPNYDKTGKYKERLADLVRETKAVCVIDLHGMDEEFAKRRRLGQVEIGTAHGQSLLTDENKYLLDIVKTQLEHNDIEVSVNKYFTAGFLNTITSYSSRELHTPAMQLEIGGGLRDVSHHPECYEQLAIALCTAIHTIVKGEQKKKHLSTWHVDEEAVKALYKAAREYKRRHPPSGEIFVYPPME